MYDIYDVASFDDGGIGYIRKFVYRSSESKKLDLLVTTKLAYLYIGGRIGTDTGHVLDNDG